MIKLDPFFFIQPWKWIAATRVIEMREIISISRQTASRVWWFKIGIWVTLVETYFVLSLFTLYNAWRSNRYYIFKHRTYSAKKKGRKNRQKENIVGRIQFGKRKKMKFILLSSQVSSTCINIVRQTSNIEHSKLKNSKPVKRIRNRAHDHLLLTMCECYCCFSF